MESRLSTPHPAGDILFLGTDSIGIDGGRGELGVPEPFLDQVERDTGGDGRHPKAMPQPLGRGMRSLKPGDHHDIVHGPPSGHPAPGPELDSTAAPSAGLLLADAVDHVERLEQRRGTGTLR